MEILDECIIIDDSGNFRKVCYLSNKMFMLQDLNSNAYEEVSREWVEKHNKLT